MDKKRHNSLSNDLGGCNIWKTILFGIGAKESGQIFSFTMTSLGFRLSTLVVRWIVFYINVPVRIPCCALFLV